MKDSIYLTINNESVREHLKQLGYYVCPCCDNAPWIHYFREVQDNGVVLSLSHPLQAILMIIFTIACTFVVVFRITSAVGDYPEYDNLKD